MTRNIVVASGRIASIYIETIFQPQRNSFSVQFVLVGSDNNEIKLICIGLEKIGGLNLYPCDNASIAIEEISNPSWEEKCFHVRMASSDDFDFFCSSYEILNS